MFSRINISGRAVVAVATTAFLAYLFIVPLGMLLFSSFRATKDLLPFEATRFTLSNYINVFSSELTYRLLSNTLQYTVIAITIGLGLALVFAWVIERTQIGGRNILVVLVLTSLGIPGIVEAMAWALIANPTNGVLNVALRNAFGLAATDGPVNIYSIVGMGFVTGLKIVPSSYILIASTMARMDPAFEEASFASGASRFTTFRRITSILLRPGLMSAVIYFGVVIIETFETPAVLGMPRRLWVFSTLIFRATHPSMGLPDYGIASGYSMVSLIIAFVLIYLYHIQVRQKDRFAVVTGKGYRPQRVTMRRRWQVIFWGLLGIYAVLSALIPLIVLILASLGILYTPGAFELITLKYYKALIHYPGIFHTSMNTVIVSLGSATITMVLALLTSWLAVRSGFRGGSIPDRFTIVAVAMPTIVIALGLVFFYTRFPLPIYGTIWIIMIAHITRFSAYAARVMHASYLQVHHDLEEASEASGGSWFTTITRIVLPLLWPAFIRGWLWVFVMALRDVTLSLMLYTVYNDTVGVRLWIIWMEDANFGLGAALAVPLALVSLGLSMIISRPTMVQKEAKVA